ncbi:MAG: methyltransferase domain-containing protein [Bacteroidetes bacterium]|nr:methyltransferase domain-containing protein [Bacteroidota bacterium]
MQKNSFDSYAKDYDADFSFSPIGKMQRERVYHFLTPYLQSKLNILEINCGTGEDAKRLSALGNKVDASDISEEMIKVCKEKKIENVNFDTCDARNLLSKYKTNTYDLIFSNFGGLNCLSEKELESFASDANQLLKKDGILACVIMGRKCRWENFFFRIKKDPRLNRRKTTEGLKTQINESVFNTYYYSPAEFAQLSKTSFKLVKHKPIGYFVPPSFFNSFYKNKLWILKLLNVFEKLFAQFSFQSDAADHYLIILQKNGD